MNIKLSLDALTVLDAIDRQGSFAAAAEELHRVPSAMTYSVQKLEQDLDVLLFDRRGHRARLTEAGRHLLNEGRHLLHAAAELEARVKRVATGYEVELRVVVNDVIPFERIYDLLREFYREPCGTRLRLLTEVYGGAWDALASGRADLVIGAPGEGPAGGGYATRPMGTVKWEFMVAPTHPLASATEPFTNEVLLQHRQIVAADSSRNLPPRSAGLLTGQNTLTVPNILDKIAFQTAGLGAGFLPVHLTRVEVQRGRLLIKRTLEPKPDSILFTAWRTGERGEALRWFLERLEQRPLAERLLS